ncbi:hypothetical protein DFO52_11257 [Enterobacter sp. AG326]|nr:hypothetical protein DFO52_11257 [Enterobacter sp. AG326]
MRINITLDKEQKISQTTLDALEAELYRNLQPIYRGETLEYYRPGGWVFFQRPKDCGGGYWMGRTYDGVFMIEYERPVSLSDGMDFLASMKKVEAKSEEFDPNYSLF